MKSKIKEKKSKELVIKIPEKDVRKISNFERAYRYYDDELRIDNLNNEGFSIIAQILEDIQNFKRFGEIPE